jgi:SAM-dependent methyltransferase
MEKPKRSVSEEDLARLKQQREQSDGAYDDALSTLDRALYEVPDFPHPPPGPDEAQVTPLNERWQILRTRPQPGGWRGRIARVVWALVEPVFNEQQAFNSLLVDHINRNIPPQRETAKSIAATIASLSQQIQQLVGFHSVTLQYLQRITPFVNSKDYEFAALARRQAEDGNELIFSIDRTQRALTSAIQALSDEMLKHVESLGARVLRSDARWDNVDAAMSVVQQQSVALQREMARFASAKPSGSADALPPKEPVAAGPSSAHSSTLAADSPVESWKYPAFEAAFRGSERDIRGRMADYVPLFASARDVLDVGCGRGEFLDLLRDSGVAARGIDLNHEMVEMCRARGLDVSHGDGLSHLRALDDQSLGGLFAAQVVEHLTPDYLLAFLNEAQRVLRPSAPIVLETINVACWLAFFQSYIRDITHAKPLHPDTLKYLVMASGFRSVEVQFRAPVPNSDRLQRVPEEDDDNEPLANLARTVNANVDALNKLMFTYQDYAIIAKK